MFLDKILIFILFLGPLVFFHELGHFLFARFFGVRVEVFSIGFGPKLFTFKRGDTEYAVSLIPLGGYVKMFGDDPLNKDAVPLEERKFSFTHKNKWQRFWIVLGGPLANIIIAYLLFAGLFISGEKSPELRVGRIDNDTRFHTMGFRSGDIIKKVNDKPVNNATDIALGTDDKILTMTVEGEGSVRTLNIGLGLESFFEEFIKYPNFLQKSLVVDKKGNVFIISDEENTVDWNQTLDQVQAWYSPEKKYFLYPYNGDLQKSTFDESVDLASGVSLKSETTWKGFLESNRLRPLDMMVSSVQMNSAADEVGMKSGDVILTLNGTSVYNFMNLRKLLQKTKEDSVDITLWRDGKILNQKLIPKVKAIDKETIKLIGVRSGGIYSGPRKVETEGKPFLTAVMMAGPRTWDSVVKTLQGFKKLILGEVSLKQVGGPLSIGKVASDSYNSGLTQFFQLMALISINLGVINLFPIPVLDGGHIAFIMLEIINGGPLSRKKMEIAQQVGLSLLLIIMFGSIFNDFTKFFL